MRVNYQSVITLVASGLTQRNYWCKLGIGSRENLGLLPHSARSSPYTIPKL